MGQTTLAAAPLLPEPELARVARILARFLAGRQPATTGTQTTGRAAGQGLDFLDFREYQSGDDFRTIDWHATARSRRTQVRRYCGEVSSDWYLCVDGSASMGIQGGANWLLARKLTAALAYVLIYLGHRVGLLLFSGEIDAVCSLGRGYAQYARILKTLDAHSHLPRGGRSDLGACAAVVGRHHPVMVVSDFIAEDAMVNALVRMRASQRELHIFQLDAVPDWQLPAADTLVLEDIESGQVAICADTRTAQAEARLRLAALQQDLSAWARRFRVPYSRCRGDDNWCDLLLHHFIRA